MQAAKMPVLTKDLFDKLDRDRSGTIDLSELKEGMKPSHRNKCDRLFESIVLDHDNHILSSRTTINFRNHGPHGAS